MRSWVAIVSEAGMKGVINDVFQAFTPGDKLLVLMVYAHRFWNILLPKRMRQQRPHLVHGSPS